MTQYNSWNVKLSKSQLNKLKKVIIKYDCQFNGVALR